MKYRRVLRYHGLKRPRVRQTWNKYNLYNLNNLREPKTLYNTFFQQKWGAKALARGYHGEHIKEKKWERMFSRRLLSVTDMDPKYMAHFDGSEQAAGRGSGKTQAPGAPPAPRNGTSTKHTPYMQMTFAPLERRLDIAIFRALFASSARQAHSLVVHGAVKVNGMKMKYPGYLLNPGDLFQVDVDRVLDCTGVKKATAPKKIEAASEPVKEESGKKLKETKIAAKTLKKRRADIKKLYWIAKGLLEGKSQSKSDGEAETEANKVLRMKRQIRARKNAVRALVNTVQKINPLTPDQEFLDDESKATELVTNLSELLQELHLDFVDPERARQKFVEAEMAKAKLEAQIQANKSTVLRNYPSNAADMSKAEKMAAKREAKREAERILLGPVKEAADQLQSTDRGTLSQLIVKQLVNPYDPKKTYVTPWQPRPYMSPFAFIPRYLEVNQNICAAVYLRHPVARQGLAEVPTPFSEELNQLAHNWYLRRG
ncbi:putative rRNA binding protein [Lasiosphaeria ovina]|uniref:rRNA binding protein n=1 Tax=Lasiosphaeria ovina TaxID=92902 RepID=A0AAE0K3V5_9PEZI|nr:putative rRNA binding protein [Lasiosphaeria ovina]